VGLLGKCRRCEAYEHLNQALIAEKADDRELIIKLLAENRDLVDKVLALSQPQALREYRREPLAPEKVGLGPPRPRFPGLAPPRRPPVTAAPAPEGQASAEEILDGAIKRLKQTPWE
jgi:hypothetical protein